MAADASNKTFEYWRSATEKFDYFMLAGTGALCAFVAERMEFGKIGPTPQTLELVALLVLVLSVAAGIARVRAYLLMVRLNSESLQRHGEAKSLTHLLRREPESNRFWIDNEMIDRAAAVAFAEKRRAMADALLEPMRDAQANAHFWAITRNAALGAGFLLLVAARVWAPYVAP
jgi:hypothetical protein